MSAFAKQYAKAVNPFLTPEESVDSRPRLSRPEITDGFPRAVFPSACDYWPNGGRIRPDRYW